MTRVTLAGGNTPVAPGRRKAGGSRQYPPRATVLCIEILLCRLIYYGYQCQD
jgi:hypothetical protein